MDTLITSRVVYVDFSGRKVMAEFVQENDKWDLVAKGLYKYTRACKKGYAFLKTDFYGLSVYEKAS
jgi:hypothetical protein